LFRRPNGPLLVYALIALTSVIGQFAADQYLLPRLAASLPGDEAYLAKAFFYCWLPRQAICFGFGILLHDYIELKNRPVLGTLLLVAAALSSAWGAHVALLFALAGVILTSNFTLSFMAVLGRHSYAIYLAHFAVLSAITALLQLDLVPLFVLVTLASLALSCYVIEPLVERRFNRLGHLLASQGRPSKVAATVA
jgi:peptidoglycan/LPS O-acetylase OafA/YrhL